MALTGTLTARTVIKSCGDVFHELFMYKPHHISNISAEKIQAIDLHAGEFGTVGSVRLWNYIHDGKEKVSKEVIEAIDEEKKSLTFKLVEGDLMKLYKSFKITLHVDTNGEENLVSWTFDYEKLKEDVPYPTSQMDFCLHLTKDIESHHLKDGGGSA